MNIKLTHLDTWFIKINVSRFDINGTVVWCPGTPKIYSWTSKSYCTIPIGQMKKKNIYIHEHCIKLIEMYRMHVLKSKNVFVIP